MKKYLLLLLCAALVVFAIKLLIAGFVFAAIVAIYLAIRTYIRRWRKG